MSGTEATAQPAGHKRTAALTLAALGVVFGDIGTSPLYTVKECFSEFTGLKPTPENVLGILSLITWALIVIVTLKYVLVVMRADNRGEGGVLALMALVSRRAEISGAPAPHLPHARHRRRRAVLRRLPAHAGDLGAERRRGPHRRHARLRAAGRADRARRASSALFAVQHFGTAGVGRWFGPITLVWFVVLFVLGVTPDRRGAAACWPPSRRITPIDFALRHELRGLRRPGRRHARRHRCRGALRRHGPFRRASRSAWPGCASCCRRCWPTTTARARCCWSTRRRSENPFFRLAPELGALSAWSASRRPPR